MDNLPDDFLGEIQDLLSEGVPKTTDAAFEAAGKEIGKEVGKQIVAHQFDNNTAPHPVRNWRQKLRTTLKRRSTIPALILIITITGLLRHATIVAKSQQGYETIYLIIGKHKFPLHSMMSGDNKDQELRYDSVMNRVPREVRDNEGESVISVGPGRKILRMWLPDSILLILGPSSRVVLSKDFENGTRSLLLVGKAIFQVPLRSQALNIRTNNNQTIAVKKGLVAVTAYPEADYEADLIEGDMLVEINQKNHVPAPGRAVIQEWDTKKVSSQDIDTAMTLSWKKGCYPYIKEPLYEVFRQLERIYPERIIVEDDETGFLPYSGLICKDHSLVDVLESMEDIGFGFDKRGDIHVWKVTKTKLPASPFFK